MKQSGKKLKVSIISVLLVLGVASGPVRADHDSHNNNLIAPLAAFIVLGSLFNHSHGHHFKYSKHRHHYYGHKGHRHNGHRHDHRARSYSSEGYGRNSKRFNRH